MEWTQIKVHCRSVELETVCAVMSMIDAGLQIEDYSDIKENLMTMYGELIDEKILNSDRTAAAVSIYVSEERDLENALAFIEKRLAECSLSCVIEKIGVNEEDWANQWKQFYKPLRIGKHLLVLPPWEHCDKREDDIVILMDPGMAFGTGTHETTRLSLEMLEKHLSKGDTLLDIGTGSGILSIAGVKLGAACACAYDIDPAAVRVARENAEKNRVDDRITCGVSDLLKGVDRKMAPFSFVCANIVADILIRMAPDIASFMAVGARLVASGIIDSRRNDVFDAMTRGGLSLADEKSESDWNVLVFEKR